MRRLARMTGSGFGREILTLMDPSTAVDVGQRAGRYARDMRHPRAAVHLCQARRGKTQWRVTRRPGARLKIRILTGDPEATRIRTHPWLSRGSTDR